MGNDATQLVVAAGGGRLMVAPKGTVAPVDSQAAWGQGWIDLGYIAEDGLGIKPESETKDVTAWQSLFPVRKIVTGRKLTFSCALEQWNRETLPLAFGGGAPVAGAGAGEARYDLPHDGAIDERAFGIEWQDGAKAYRVIVPRGLVTDVGEIKLARGAASALQVTFEAEGDDNGIGYLLTNDPALQPG